MKRRFSRRALLLLVLASGAGMAPASAQPGPGAPRITNEHLDVRLGFVANQWQLDLYAQESDLAFSPAQTILYGGEAARQNRPGGPTFDFLGPSAPLFWNLPQAQNFSLPFLGISTVSIPVGTFTGSVTFTLLSVSGPGHFALWQAGAIDGNPTVFISSFLGGITAEDQVQMPQRIHDHFNWSFSAPGVYGITFQASGLRPGGVRVTSAPTTYYFELLGSSAQAPEPTPLALAGLVSLFILPRIRKSCFRS